MKTIALLALALVAGCSSKGDTTTGKRIALEVKIAAAPGSLQPFTNGLGWQVAVSKALVATGAIYVYDGATILSRAEPRRRPLDELLGIKSAFAHPGHYVPGNALGQMLTASSADLRAGDTGLGAGDGVTGVARSATFAFDAPAKGPFAGELGDRVAVLEGTATKGAETRVFRARVAKDEILDAKAQPAIEGCPFTEVTMSGDGVVTVAVRLTGWLDQVDFDAVPRSNDGAPVELDGVARNGLVRGFKAGDAYRFTYAAK